MFFDRFPNEIIDKILILLDMNTLINLRDFRFFKSRVIEFIEDKMTFEHWHIYSIKYLKNHYSTNIKFINTNESEVDNILKNKTQEYHIIKFSKYFDLFRNEKDFFLLFRSYKDYKKTYYLYHEYGKNNKDECFITFKKYRDFEEFLDEVKILI